MKYLKRFNNLINVIVENFTTEFNVNFCYILGKHQIFQPKNENLQCIYIDKHLKNQIESRKLNGDIDYSLEKIEFKINKFIVEILNNEDDKNYIKKFTNDPSKNEAKFGIPFICECEKSNLKIKIIIKYDQKLNRFYGFAKTCWHNIKAYKISKFHVNEIIRTLKNEENNKSNNRIII